MTIETLLTLLKELSGTYGILLEPVFVFIVTVLFVQAPVSWFTNSLGLFVYRRFVVDKELALYWYALMFVLLGAGLYLGNIAFISAILIKIVTYLFAGICSYDNSIKIKRATLIELLDK